MKVKFPVNLFLIDKWKAYRGQLPEKSDKRHIIIIIYITRTIINYFYITSKVDKAKIIYKNDKKALIELDTKEWTKLKKKSCIQCGKRHLKCISLETLKAMYENDKIEYVDEIPDGIKTKIIQAVRDSKTYTDPEKQMYVSTTNQSCKISKI
ncbi:MAG: hypothetical protein LBT58_00355 [Endomicrobium sp.]|nr:hypothetical protein [Endomicrobium sp.]